MTALEKIQMRHASLAREAPADSGQANWTREREVALARYWKDELSGRRDPLNDEEIEELLSVAELETAIAALGDAARMGLLNPADCSRLVLRPELCDSPKGPWAKAELKLRIQVDALVNQPSAEKRQSALECLLAQRRAWAIKEVLPTLSLRELDWGESRLTAKDVLTRSAREEVRQRVRRLLRERRR